MKDISNQSASTHDPRGSLVILGSGIAAIAHLTLEAIGHLKEADVVFYHANSGVVASYIRELNGNAVDLYEFYGEGKIRTVTYVQMAELMLRKVRAGLFVVGLFHGHPGFFVHAARRSLEIARMEGYPTALIPAISAVDCLFADLRIDPGVSGVQILKASHVLKENASLATESNVVLIQVGSVGDNTFSFSGFKQAKLELLFDRLISIYGEDHDSVWYVAPIFPGFDPIISVRKLREYKNHSLRDTLHAATLYLPPAGIPYASMTSWQAFKGREPYGQFEATAISELETHQTPPGYKLRGASPAMVRAVSDIATGPHSALTFRNAPSQFAESHAELTTQEQEALLSRDTGKMRTVTTKQLKTI
jgi:siroheme synthase